MGGNVDSLPLEGGALATLTKRAGVQGGMTRAYPVPSSANTLELVRSRDGEGMPIFIPTLLLLYPQESGTLLGSNAGPAAPP